jgi:hypothetical protein
MHVAVSRLESIREWGIGLVFVGGLLLIMGLMWVVVCGAGAMGPCLGSPFQGRQGSLELLGTCLLVAGLVLVFVGRRTAIDRPPATPQKV